MSLFGNCLFSSRQLTICCFNSLLSCFSCFVNILRAVFASFVNNSFIYCICRIFNSLNGTNCAIFNAVYFGNSICRILVNFFNSIVSDVLHRSLIVLTFKVGNSTLLFSLNRIFSSCFRKCDLCFCCFLIKFLLSSCCYIAYRILIFSTGNIIICFKTSALNCSKSISIGLLCYILFSWCQLTVSRINPSLSVCCCFVNITSPIILSFFQTGLFTTISFRSNSVDIFNSLIPNTGYFSYSISISAINTGSSSVNNIVNPILISISL